MRGGFADGGRWTAVRAGSADDLVAASHLFDGPVTREGAEAALRCDGQVFLLAMAEGAGAVGFVSGVRMHHPDKAPEMFVNELGVDPQWRRRGVARGLLAALADVARDSGCVCLWTATGRGNGPALAAYRSAGASIDEDPVLVEIPVPVGYPVREEPGPRS